MIGIVVGLAAEARIARRLPGHVEVAVGGGTADGARRAAEHLLRHGARGLVSFGLAAGLALELRAGDLVVPRRVLADGAPFATDRGLCKALGGSTPHDLLHSERVVVTAADKQRLLESSRCAALDMESGVVARAALAESRPFAVLRAVCDPASRSLPPAALVALSPDGEIGLGPVLRSLAGHPGQLPALLAVARDAYVARRALLARVRMIAALE
jgi:hopanoid-associated phosphorylase